MHPQLGETWHGTVAAIHRGTAHVHWHSYTPRGGGRRKPMRHSTRVLARQLTPGRVHRRIKHVTMRRGAHGSGKQRGQAKGWGESLDPRALRAAGKFRRSGHAWAYHSIPPGNTATDITGGSGMPAATTTQVKGLFDEARHPRGRDGKFIEVGHDVTLPGGMHGRVAGMVGGDRILVDAADGTHRVIPAEELTSDDPAARGFHAMHSPVGTGDLPWKVSGETAHFHNNLGIDRGDMPQLSGTVHGKYVPSSELVPKFMDQMRAQGVSVSHERVPASSLKPTQTTGDTETIRGIADSIKGGKVTKPIIVSADNRVLDGHHTWAGQMLAGKEDPDKAAAGMDVIRVGLPIRHLIGKVNDFDDAEGITKRKPGEMANPAYAKPPTHAPVAPLTDSEYDAHRAIVKSKLDAAITAGHTTDRMHTIGGNGEVYTPDRAAMHKQIIDDMLKANAHVPNEGKGVMAGGLGGAGKTTVLTKHADIDTSKFMTLNPDDVKEEMAKRGMVPHVEGLTPMEASPLVHEEASHITNMAAKQAYAQKKNVIWDITMSSPKSAAKRVDDMHNAGYGHVRGVFVDIPAETSVSRALARHRRGLEDYRVGKGNGGRYVPPELIRESAGAGPKSVNRQAFETVRHKFNQWDVYDNSVHGRMPVHIEGSRGV